MIIKPNNTTILVTGGAGYIGSHISYFLAQKGYNIVILDTFNHNQVLPNQFKIKQLLEKNTEQITILKKACCLKI